MADTTDTNNPPPMSQRERVDLLQTRLDGTEARRREAARDGDRKLASDLANLIRDFIGAAEPHDLRSLVTRWTLERGKAADEARMFHALGGSA